MSNRERAKQLADYTRPRTTPEGNVSRTIATPDRDFTAGIIYALLDIADAIRERGEGP